MLYHLRLPHRPTKGPWAHHDSTCCAWCGKRTGWKIQGWSAIGLEPNRLLVIPDRFTKPASSSHWMPKTECICVYIYILPAVIRWPSPIALQGKISAGQLSLFDDFLTPSWTFHPLHNVHQSCTTASHTFPPPTSSYHEPCSFSIRLRPHSSTPRGRFSEPARMQPLVTRMHFQEFPKPSFQAFLRQTGI